VSGKKIMNSESFFSETTNTRFVSIPNKQPVLLLLTDILGSVICLLLTLWLFSGKVLAVLDPLLFIFVLLVLGGLYLANTYHPDIQIAGLRAPARVILSNLIVGILCVVLVYLVSATLYDIRQWLSILLPSLVTFTIWAVISRLLAAKWERSNMQQSRWLILGANDFAVKFCQNFLEKHPLARLVVLTEANEDVDSVRLWKSATNKVEEISLQLNTSSAAKNSLALENTQKTNIAIATLVSNNNSSESKKLNKVGNLNDLETWTSQSWSGVFVATNGELSDKQVQQLMPLRLKGIPVYRLPQAYESFWFKLPAELLEDTWFTFSSGFNLLPGGFSLKLKRIVDLAFATLLFLVLSPLMLITAFLIKLDNPGPILYSQLRTGQNNQPFRVYKFRSMYQDAEERGAKWASERDPRITRVGYLIRLTRLDELPQIWNVLRGEMSLIGPRPERPEFDSQLRKEIPYYDLRYLVKPGITGWAQVLYPYGASVEDAYEKLSYDLYYIKNYSLWLDIAIVFKTIRVVLLGKGR
jgi:exopolysaccharide biosynthesis polyprenyl glycosylphosphotransferase